MEIQQKVQRVLKRSIQYAFNHPKSALAYITKAHAQEMDEQVMYKHIKLYVNDFSLHLEEEGREAIQELFKRSAKETTNIFIT